MTRHGIVPAASSSTAPDRTDTIRIPNTVPSSVPVVRLLFPNKSLEAEHNPLHVQHLSNLSDSVGGSRLQSRANRICRGSFPTSQHLPYCMFESAKGRSRGLLGRTHIPTSSSAAWWKQRLGLWSLLTGRHLADFTRLAFVCTESWICTGRKHLPGETQTLRGSVHCGTVGSGCGGGGPVVA